MWLLLALACHGKADSDTAACADPVTWYADRDGDGFGSFGDTQAACEAPTHFVADDSDCNDVQKGVHPGADEVCNDVDDDCDGQTDPDGTPGAVTYFVDADRDGYGSTSTVSSCAPRSGLVDNSDDCDDGDADVSPAATEACGTHVDEDCDGTSDDCAPKGAMTVSGAPIALAGVATNDYAGRGIAGLGDVDGDGLGDLLVGASGVTVSGRTKSGTAYLLRAPQSGSVRAADATIVGAATGDFAGASVGLAGDLDGDGAQEVWVASPFSDAGGPDSGAITLVPVSASGSSVTTDWPSMVGASGDHAGVAVARAGKALAIGAPGASSGAGAVYVATSAGDLASAVRIEGAAGDAAGSSVAAADVDGDGVIDLVVGAPGASSGDGAVYVVTSIATGSLLDADVLPGSGGEAAGTSVAAGDLDGDGKADVIVGAPTGNVVRAGSAVLQGEPSAKGAGASVAVPGDVDQDGRDDLLVGASSASTTPSKAYLVLGGVDGTVSLSSARASYAGLQPDDQIGERVAGAGDVDGDGYPDLLFGASDVDSNQGAVYVMLGAGL